MITPEEFNRALEIKINSVPSDHLRRLIETTQNKNVNVYEHRQEVKRSIKKLLIMES